jgi:hypothetical protein
VTNWEAAALAACELAYVVRWPVLAVVAWMIGYAVLGPVFTW